MKLSRKCCGAIISAFTLAEVMVAVFVVGILVVSLLGAFSSGIGVVQAARENMRATQILVQKMETLRLYTWSQGVNPTLAPSNFLAYYDPTGTNPGALYRGTYATQPAPADIPVAYRDQMRQVHITVNWMNFGENSRGKLQRRQMQTFVARYGMQNYVYQ